MVWGEPKQTKENTKLTKTENSHFLLINTNQKLKVKGKRHTLAHADAHTLTHVFSRQLRLYKQQPADRPTGGSTGTCTQKGP